MGSVNVRGIPGIPPCSETADPVQAARNIRGWTPTREICPPRRERRDGKRVYALYLVQSDGCGAWLADFDSRAEVWFAAGAVAAFAEGEEV